MSISLFDENKECCARIPLTLLAIIISSKDSGQSDSHVYLLLGFWILNLKQLIDKKIDTNRVFFKLFVQRFSSSSLCVCVCVRPSKRYNFVVTVQRHLVSTSSSHSISGGGVRKSNKVGMSEWYVMVGCCRCSTRRDCLSHIKMMSGGRKHATRSSSNSNIVCPNMQK